MVLDLSSASNELVNLLKYYLISCTVEEKSPWTIASYRQKILDFLKFASNHGFPGNITGITSNHIRLFLLHLQEIDLGSGTRNAYYRVLHTFLNWLVTEGYLKKGPMDSVKPPQIPKKNVKPFTRRDIEMLLLLWTGTRFLEVRNKAIILMLLDTGLKLTEMVNI